ncbi:hypothetical protein DUNSADRAFT_4459 [Dunaliella salina]|uniref:RNA-binding S4 domain-containing protein n=1 Tax=Dunaliella salina TaxID=3046 RepID=A0ABQ7GS30_DUNSA|nr:hypothetical protein DUNSADRAFT_4459 [Dunaliella salina]|eukprot:KAF5837411.1 hypothetical protein DUNSADRAFT_4459 [Dunaliella salina]
MLNVYTALTVHAHSQQQTPKPASPAPKRGHSSQQLAKDQAGPGKQPQSGGRHLSRLNKRMAELGLCSRREADDWIAQGLVRVDGQVATTGLQVGISGVLTFHPK